MAWNEPRDESPKPTRVIHLGEVTKFVDDNVVRDVRRECRDFVIETQIARARAAPPA